VQLFQAFDAAIRGLPIGGTTTLEAKEAHVSLTGLLKVKAVNMGDAQRAC